MMGPKPVLQIRRTDAGKEISVAATWPDGHSERIGGFKTEADANTWIADKFYDWLEQRQARRAARPAG